MIVEDKADCLFDLSAVLGASGGGHAEAGKSQWEAEVLELRCSRLIGNPSNVKLTDGSLTSTNKSLLLRMPPRENESEDFP